MIAVVFEIFESALAVDEVRVSKHRFTSQSEKHIKDMLVWRESLEVISKLSEFYSEGYR